MKTKTKHYLNTFVSSLLAGMLIGLGCVIYLSTMASSKIVGAVFFALGLFLILVFGLFLYTGKIGVVLDNKPNFLIDLLIGLAGNFIGIICLTKLLLLTRTADSLKVAALTLANTKLNDSWYSVLILSIFCGFMIYLAVKGYKEASSGVEKTISVFLAIAFFILSSYEHCVANVGYFSLAGVCSWKMVLYIFIMVLGNSIGSILLDLLFKAFKKTQ